MYTSASYGMIPVWGAVLDGTHRTPVTGGNATVSAWANSVADLA
ncbi:MAG: hypothetical protein ACREXO_11785 [Advenella sp.]